MSVFSFQYYELQNISHNASLPGHVTLRSKDFLPFSTTEKHSVH